MIRPFVRRYTAAFEGLPVQVWLFAGTVFLQRTGSTVLPFLALYLTEQMELPVSRVGVVIGLLGLGGVAGSYAGGWLCDRWPARVVQVSGLAASGVFIFAAGFTRSKLALAALLFLVGVAAWAFAAANGVATASWCAPHLRSRGAALRRIAANLGWTISPVLGGFLAVRSYRWLFVVDAVAAVLGAAILLCWARSPRPAASRQPESSANRSPWRDRPFLLFLALFTLNGVLFFQLMSTMILTFRDHYRFSEDTIGLVIAVSAVVIVMIEMQIIHACAGRNPLRVIALGALLIGLGLALLPRGTGFAFAAFATVIWTFGEILVYPFAEGFVANRAGESSRGRYMGLLTTATSVGLVLSPVVCMSVYERFGITFLWTATGVLGACVAAGFLALSRTHR